MRKVVLILVMALRPTIAPPWLEPRITRNTAVADLIRSRQVRQPNGSPTGSVSETIIAGPAPFSPRL